tara:strand:+ start:1738 stop:2793 length:1056 start_codon:yes stop_codon:yes gene_type:complete
MKISIGTNIKEGPWGGGNLFAINLKNYLESNNHEVVNHLYHNDIDIILLTEPRKTSESSAFTHIDVKRYLKYVNFKTIVVHRLNECDERKSTNFVNDYLIEANKVGDQSVFVSEWLKKLFIDQGIKSENNAVIYGGANSEIFNSNNFHSWAGVGKIKLVTHHWGANWNKGFETYSYLDELLDRKEWSDKFEFTYIGNLPKDFNFKNTKVVDPLSGKDLANEIKKNHLYITGSLNEPSGNHHIEAAQCGLPILYLNSGGTPEYCNDYGIEFNISNLEEKLDEMINNYKTYSEKMIYYSFNSERMCDEYFKLFTDLINDKEQVLEKRKLKNKSNTILKNIYLITRKISEIFSN